MRPNAAISFGGGACQGQQVTQYTRHKRFVGGLPLLGNGICSRVSFAHLHPSLPPYLASFLVQSCQRLGFLVTDDADLWAAPAALGFPEARRSPPIVAVVDTKKTEVLNGA